MTALVAAAMLADLLTFAAVIETVGIGGVTGAASNVTAWMGAS